MKMSIWKDENLPHYLLENLDSCHCVRVYVSICELMCRFTSVCPSESCWQLLDWAQCSMLAASLRALPSWPPGIESKEWEVAGSSCSTKPEP